MTLPPGTRIRITAPPEAWYHGHLATVLPDTANMYGFPIVAELDDGTRLFLRANEVELA